MNYKRLNIKLSSNSLASVYVTKLVADGLMLKIKKCYCEIRFFMLILRPNGKIRITD